MMPTFHGIQWAYEKLGTNASEEELLAEECKMFWNDWMDINIYSIRIQKAYEEISNSVKN
jgi:hypothetical protein